MPFQVKNQSKWHPFDLHAFSNHSQAIEEAVSQLVQDNQIHAYLATNHSKPMFSL